MLVIGPQGHIQVCPTNRKATNFPLPYGRILYPPVISVRTNHQKSFKQGCGKHETIRTPNRTPLLDALVSVWEDSVRATHHFLSDEEILKIKTYVPQALSAVENLVIAENTAGQPIAFMGVENHRLEMLFLASSVRGHGLGRQLMQYGDEHYGITELTVNEQNPQAVAFYEHLGFTIYKRTDHDEEGNPYPLLYMKRG